MSIQYLRLKLLHQTLVIIRYQRLFFNVCTCLSLNRPSIANHSIRNRHKLASRFKEALITSLHHCREPKSRVTLVMIRVWNNDGVNKARVRGPTTRESLDGAHTPHLKALYWRTDGTISESNAAASRYAAIAEKREGNATDIILTCCRPHRSSMTSCVTLMCFVDVKMYSS